MTQKSLRILIVDDEDSVRLSMMAFLEDMGYEAFIAYSAEDALEKLKTVQIDIAIIDIRLPNMNGNDLIYEINQLYPKIRFLIHTGSVFYSLSEELKKIGIKKEDILVKPLKDMNQLIQSINIVYDRG